MPKAITVTIAGKQLSLSNLDKIMYPEAGFTKAQVIDYYTRIAPAMLPHLKDRPISLKRFPDGVDGMFFYEKRCPAHRPGWVGTCSIPVKHGEIAFCTVDGVETLAWLANIACLEIHAYLYKRTAPDVPTMMVFDLDPGEPATLLDSCQVGLHVRRLLAADGLECLAKSSGSKGLHLYVPLNTPTTFKRTKSYARAVAIALEKRFPERVVSVMAKSERVGKIFIDWSQNDAAKTTCCVYSLRARARPTVSAPLSWPEIERAARSGDVSGLVREAGAVLASVEREGDAFAALESLKQKLPAADPASGEAGEAHPATTSRSGDSTATRKPARGSGNSLVKPRGKPATGPGKRPAKPAAGRASPRLARATRSR